MLSTAQDSATELFNQGSGLNHTAMAVTLQVIGVGLAIVIFAWLVHGIFVAYKDNQMKQGEVVWNGLKAMAVLLFVVYVLLN